MNCDEMKQLQNDYFYKLHEKIIERDLKYYNKAQLKAKKRKKRIAMKKKRKKEKKL